MKVILYGASGHGKVIADILRAEHRLDFTGFIDDDPAKARDILGTSGVLRKLRGEGIEWAIVSIGSNRVRQDKAEWLEKNGFRLATAVHPSAVVAPDVRIGGGTVVMAGAVINAGTVIGKNVIINTRASVDHDCVIGDGAHISPGVSLAGRVSVERLAHVGIGACVIPGIAIGVEARVGAGAVVIRDVPEGVTVVGNPARPLGKKQEA